MIRYSGSAALIKVVMGPRGYRRRYLYTERMFRSFYRNVPLPEEIIPSKVAARVENGILKVDIPKKTSIKTEGDVTKVDVK